MRRLPKQHGNITIILLFIIIVGAVFLTGGYSHYFKKPFEYANTTPTNLIPIQIKNANTQKSLQLKEVKFAAPTPTTPPPVVHPTQPPQQPVSTTAPRPTPTPRVNQPGGACIHEQLMTNGCHCDSVEQTGPQAGQPNSWKVQCTSGQIANGPFSGNNVAPNWCQNKSDGLYCVGKPVIYLYPEKTMFVDVNLTIPGDITESIPLYPMEGWKSVEAHPDGSLVYEGKTYHELYYESAVRSIPKPENGIIISTQNLKQELTQYTYQLGLKPNEQQEFLDYWLPKLDALNSPYILFSVLTLKQKDTIDHVEILPKPDTMIEFIAYFKPLSTYIPTTPLVLPHTPPERKGFIAVEWGGTIDTH